MGLATSRVSSASDTAEDRPFYAHQKLPENSRCFRVFQLEPLSKEGGGDTAQDGLGGVLRGRITIANLDQCIAFDALSYCWEGSIEPKSSTTQDKDWILIDTESCKPSRLGIGPSLSIALRYLRARGQLLPMFIDQICIDQCNSMEKNEQVGMMGDIYHSCQRVVAWLDVATKHTDSFFDWVPRISDNLCLEQMCSQPDRFSATLKAISDKQSSREVDEGLERDKKDIISLKGQHWDCFPHQGFLELCLRQWFRRIWIVQEACLGPELTLICGKRSCSVQELQMASLFQMFGTKLDKTQEAKERSVWTIFDPRLSDRVKHEAFMVSTLASRLVQQRALTLERHGERLHSRQGLANIVIWCNADVFDNGPWIRFGASNPRDYLYALRGLVPHDDRMMKRFKPDYTQTIEKVFTQYTRLIINPTIDILLLSQAATKKLERLPSWVPDWSADLALPHGYQSGYTPLFCAGNVGDQTVNVKTDSLNDALLVVEGIVLCEVDQVGTHTMKMPPHPRETRPSETYRVMPRSVFNFLREVRQFCERASKKPASASIPSLDELDLSVWVTTTGGHGLYLTTEESLLGGEVDGKPLLGHAWDMQLRMDVLPTIMRMRSDGLARLAETYAAAMQPERSSSSTILQMLQSFIIYWSGRLRLEVIHLYWYQKFLLARPFISETAEDMLYCGVFGVNADPAAGLLQSVLRRHVGRKCFVSAAGHVGLGPQTMEPGDLVVVLLGATTPVILRPGRKAWQKTSYIGEAYCHGFMHGQAIKDKKYQRRSFEIK